MRRKENSRWISAKDVTECVDEVCDAIRELVQRMDGKVVKGDTKIRVETNEDPEGPCVAVELKWMDDNLRDWQREVMAGKRELFSAHTETPETSSTLKWLIDSMKSRLEIAPDANVYLAISPAKAKEFIEELEPKPVKHSDHNA